MKGGNSEIIVIRIDASVYPDSLPTIDSLDVVN